MDPKTLSILSNPALLAVNQDPLGHSAFRSYLINIADGGDNPRSSIPSIQMWTGILASTSDISDIGDQVIVFVNSGTETATMNATFHQIWDEHNAEKELQHQWEVRDLWADRMSDETAADIIGNVSKAAKAAAKSSNTEYAEAAIEDEAVARGVMPAPETRVMYNATKLSYAEGLKNRDDRLLGRVVSALDPGGVLSAEVEGRSCKVFRLRAIARVAGEDENGHYDL
jgi:alpha-galactosidase